MEKVRPWCGQPSDRRWLKIAGSPSVCRMLVLYCGSLGTQSSDVVNLEVSMESPSEGAPSIGGVISFVASSTFSETVQDGTLKVHRKSYVICQTVPAA